MGFFGSGAQIALQTYLRLAATTDNSPAAQPPRMG